MPAAWEVCKTEIGPPGAIPGTKNLAILVPHTGEVTAEWTMRLRDIIVPDGTQLFFSRGMPIDVTREALIEAAYNAGFEWFFFLDSDVILPKDAIPKLLAPKIPLVCGMYPAKKTEGIYWAVWMDASTPNGGTAYAPVESWSGRYIRCDVTGCGCMLIHRSVIDRIRERNPDLPLFLWTKDRRNVMEKLNLPDDKMKSVSEDFYFCKLAKASEIDCVIDTEIQCGHLALMKLNPSLTAGLPGV